MIRFYAPDIEMTGQLPEGESAHCVRVLRLKEGDTIHVVDGRGYEFDCVIDEAHQRHTSVSIVSRKKERAHWSPRITLALAPTKSMDRMEWLVEKAVEIGVDRIVFLDCARSVRRVMKRDRIEKVMVSAMKQSLKATLPELTEMVSFDKFVSGDVSARKYMGYCDERVDRRDFADEYDGESDVSVLIGPEGDFTPEEVELAISSGYMPVTFGATRLRTETAALYALCATHTIMTQKTNNNGQ